MYSFRGIKMNSRGRGRGGRGGKAGKGTYTKHKGDLASTISKHYVLEARDREYLNYIVKTWPTDRLEDQLNKMRYFIGTLQETEKQEDTRTSYKAGQIATLVMSVLDAGSIGAILDIGAADLSILKETAEVLSASTMYALDPKAEAGENVINSLTELDDGVIDVVIMAQTIHHINPRKRAALMDGVRRVLSPGGVVVIQEHAYLPWAELHINLEVLHNFWYVKNNEDPDPFYPMTVEECDTLFSKIGLVPTKRPDIEGWQKMYWRCFAMSDTLNMRRPLPEISNEALYVTPESQLLPWNSFIKPTVGKNGQLKLFISTLQALLTFWDRELVPNLTVVYVGAAPGFNIGVINKMLIGAHIKWILYDPSDMVCSGDNITKHQRLFSDKDAYGLSGTPGVFFFSDIRRRGRTRGLAPGEIDKSLEREVVADMKMQMEWVKAMNPYQASLKMRLPFEGDSMEYLDGNVMFQSYTSPVSSETRLIPTRDANGDLYTVKWDIPTYREQLYNYNMNVRTDERQRAHLEYVLGMYIEQYGVKDVTASQLADDIVLEIDTFRQSDKQ